MTAEDLKGLVAKFKAKVKQIEKRDFPQDVWEQLIMAATRSSARGTTPAPSRTAS